MSEQLAIQQEVDMTEAEAILAPTDENESVEKAPSSALRILQGLPKDAPRSSPPVSPRLQSAPVQSAPVQSESIVCEQIEASRGEVSLCLLINRRTRSMRIIDFRAGSQTHKFDLVCEVAEREGIQRAFTVVEREEANTWAKMGFEKEGSIPGFYKRSDGYILGMEMKSFEPHQSGTRIRIQPGSPSPASDRAERAYQAGRKLARNRAPESFPKVKVQVARTRDIEKAFSNATQSGRALSGLESFGRGVEKSEYLCTARGGFSLLLGVEEQPCFDNTFLEALCAPRGDKETWLTTASIKLICAELKDRGIISVFAVSPAESVELTAAWVAAGFRRTGRLPGHMAIHGKQADAFLWSLKLGEPG